MGGTRDIHGQAAVVSHEQGREHDVLHGITERLAVVLTLKGGQLIDVLLDLVGELVKKAGANDWARVAPLITRVNGGLDSQINIFSLGGCHLGNDLACSGVHCVESLAALSIHPLSIDKKLVAHGVFYAWLSQGLQRGFGEGAFSECPAEHSGQCVD